MIPDPSDGALAGRAAAGDRAAFGLLVRRHRAAAMQLVRSLGVPETDVDDAVQDGFVAAWRSLADFDRARAFRPWLMRILVNKARDLHRRRRVRSFLYAALPMAAVRETVHPEPGPEQAALARAELARVTAMLARLPATLREALALTAIVGLSQAEAGEVLGLGARAVEGRVARARARLAALLAEDPRNI